jgi:hypothetical protein
LKVNGCVGGTSHPSSESKIKPRKKRAVKQVESGALSLENHGNDENDVKSVVIYVLTSGLMFRAASGNIDVLLASSFVIITRLDLVFW